MLKKIIIFFTILLSSFFSINFVEAVGGGSYGQGIDENIYDVITDGLKEGVDYVKDTVDGIEKDKPFSDYVQSIVAYVLMFLSTIAVIYIIWAGLNMMISGSDDEKMKNQKKTIIAVIIGIVVIWLAYSLVLTIFDMVNTAGK